MERLAQQVAEAQPLVAEFAGSGGVAGVVKYVAEAQRQLLESASAVDTVVEAQRLVAEFAGSGGIARLAQQVAEAEPLVAEFAGSGGVAGVVKYVAEAQRQLLESAASGDTQVTLDDLANQAAEWLTQLQRAETESVRAELALEDGDYLNLDSPKILELFGDRDSSSPADLEDHAAEALAFLLALTLYIAAARPNLAATLVASGREAIVTSLFLLECAKAVGDLPPVAGLMFLLQVVLVFKSLRPKKNLPSSCKGNGQEN